MAEEEFGPFDIRLTGYLRRAASALAAARQDAQAIEALVRAVAINDLHGAETADAATDLRNLAKLQQRNGQDQDARHNQDRAREISERHNKPALASRQAHAPLLRALAGIPDVRAGDSVWWHCDMIHSVAPVTDQRGWGNVMYIPAAPWCPRNERYAATVRQAFLTGSSPDDFPAEHYERDWPDRFRAADLNGTGRRGLGLE
jgi:hypothetical protein